MAFEKLDFGKLELGKIGIRKIGIWKNGLSGEKIRKNGFREISFGIIWIMLFSFAEFELFKASTHLRGSGAVQRRYHLTLHGTASVPLQIRASVWRP